MFDKQLIRKYIIIILCIVAILIALTFIRRTFSRYESDAKSDFDSKIAFFVVNDSIQEKDLYIGEIVSGGSRDFDFTVSNFDETRESKVSLDYSIIIDASTNMPLQYDIYQIIDGTEIVSDKEEEIYRDEDGTYYKRVEADDGFDLKRVVFPTDKETDKFRLRVTFPEYSEDGIDDDKENDENWMFADLVEHVRITINTRQKVKEPEPEPEPTPDPGEDTNTELEENIVVE